MKSMDPSDRLNFETISLAFARGDVSLVVCQLPDGTPVPVLCTLHHEEKHGWLYVPYAILLRPEHWPIWISSLRVPDGLQGRFLKRGLPSAHS